MNLTRNDVLRALGTDELTGYSIAERVEERWRSEGRRERFLFWTFEPTIGFSSTYRFLDKLVKDGVLERRKIGDTMWVYRRRGA